MSVELLLRGAAKLLREHAEGATPGPWCRAVDSEAAVGLLSEVSCMVAAPQNWEARS